jgi:predicted DCC family thiol-disulfide oxidoreductase YuxK
MKTLNSVCAWLALKPQQRVGIRALQFAIGSMLMFRLFTEAPFAGFFWGPHGLGYGSARFGNGFGMGMILDKVFATQFGTYAVLLVLMLGALGLIAGYRTRVATLLALVSFTLLGHRLAELGDGGDNITELVLIYMLFLLPAGARFKRGGLGVWLHNVAVLSITAQLMILYLTSGFLKATGGVWQHGTAMYVISQVKGFSQPALSGYFRNPFVTTIASYAAMFFQLWFPIAIFSRLKLPWICLGMFFHIGIAMQLGLVTFSTAMIGMELFLISDKEYARLALRIKSSWEWLLLRLYGPRRETQELLLFIDGFCPRCVAFGRAIQRWDRAGRIRVVSFRESDEYARYDITIEDLERRMYAVNLKDGEVKSGFTALHALTAQFIHLWPVHLLFSILAAARQGDRLYDALAARRRLIPLQGACGEQGCQINS